jgi:D-glutamate cyclase
LDDAIAAMERVIQEDVGRHVTPLFEAATGGLYDAAAAIAATPAPVVGLITGFFVPHGLPPAAETDGPVGAALLAAGLVGAGVRCRLATDAPCRDACVAALRGAGVAGVEVDAAAPGEDIAALIAAWRGAGVTVALAIERCGPSRDGRPRNMRGFDVSAWTAPLHALFAAGPWTTVAVGDGGNEIGMGSLPHALIARHIDNGTDIACTTPAAHLIVAGVSNWGCFALAGALALLRPDWRAGLLGALDERLNDAILAEMVEHGPAVDGVTRRQVLTVDGLPREAHAAKIAAIRALVRGA